MAMVCRPKAYLPKQGARQSYRLSGFTGLDLRGGIRPGTLAAAEGIDPRRFPEVAALPAPAYTGTAFPGEMLSLHVLGDIVFAVAYSDQKTYLYRLEYGGTERVPIATGRADVHRSISLFHRYSDPDRPDTGLRERVGIVLPEQLCIYLDSKEELKVAPLCEEGVVAPHMRQGCVHLSRLFGVGGDRVYASRYNDAGRWDLDTATDSGAANAWYSVVQSSSYGEGDFSAITVYDGHVLCMKQDSVQIINNTKNPFRVAGLLEVGPMDGRSVAEVDGRLCFASRTGVYCYNGGEAVEIGAPLGIRDYTGALGAAVGDCYYLWVPRAGRAFVYCHATGAWGSLAGFGDGPVAAMAGNGTDCYFLMADGRLFSTRESAAGAFSFTTAPLDLGRVAVRRLSRLSLRVTAAEGATLRLYAVATDGSETPLLTYTGEGISRAIESRSFSPADTSLRLRAEGVGEVCIHDMELTVSVSDSE